MAVVAVARAFNVGRNLAIMTPEKNLAWAWLGSVANKALDELANRRGGNEGCVCNDGGFDSAERRRISFVLAAVALLRREEFSGGASKVNTRAADKTSLSWNKSGYSAIDARQRAVRACREQ